MIEPAKCMAAPTACSASSGSSTARSPTSPSTNATPSGTAQRKPVERSSSTTTGHPASASARTAWLPMYPAPPVTRTVGLVMGAE